MARRHTAKRGRAPGRRGALDGEASLQSGIAHHRAGRLDAAASAYEAAIAAAPNLAAAHAMLGALQLQRGAAREALQSLDRAIALDDAQPGFHVNRGNALRALARRDEAVGAYERALVLDPRMVFAHNNLGNVLRDGGRPTDAVVCYRSALAIDSRFFPASANLALTLNKLSETPNPELIECLERAITLGTAQQVRDPALANCHNALGNLQLRDGELEQAVESYRRAIDIDPEFGQAHLNLGQALARLLDLEGSIVAIRRGLDLMPGDVPSYRRLALLLRRLGRHDEAGLVYQEWHARAPEDPIPLHMSKALLGEAPPERASPEYVRREFDDFAQNFDAVLAKLDYKAPELIADALTRHGFSLDAGLDVLDAGCGTGLSAEFLRGYARRLVGLDISAKMLALASRRGAYDELVEGDLLEWLSKSHGAFDLVVAADVMIYFGALGPACESIGRALRSDGAFVFTVESAEDDSVEYELSPGGRYRHGSRYVQQVLSDCGFRVAEAAHVHLRKELGIAVNGRVFVAFLVERA